MTGATALTAADSAPPPLTTHSDHKGHQTVTARPNQAATHPPHEPHCPPSGPATDARTHRADILAEHIRQMVDTAPPLSADQIERLRGLLPAPTPQTPSSCTTAPKPAPRHEAS